MAANAKGHRYYHRRQRQRQRQRQQQAPSITTAPNADSTPAHTTTTTNSDSLPAHTTEPSLLTGTTAAVTATATATSAKSAPAHATEPSSSSVSTTTTNAGTTSHHAPEPSSFSGQPSSLSTTTTASTSSIINRKEPATTTAATTKAPRSKSISVSNTEAATTPTASIDNATTVSNNKMRVKKNASSSTTTHINNWDTQDDINRFIKSSLELLDGNDVYKFMNKAARIETAIKSSNVQPSPNSLISQILVQLCKSNEHKIATTSIRKEYVGFVRRHTLNVPFKKFEVEDIRALLVDKNVSSSAAISSTARNKTESRHKTAKGGGINFLNTTSIFLLEQPFVFFLDSLQYS